MLIDNYEERRSEYIIWPPDHHTHMWAFFKTFTTELYRMYLPVYAVQFHVTGTIRNQNLFQHDLTTSLYTN